MRYVCCCTDTEVCPGCRCGTAEDELETLRVRNAALEAQERQYDSALDDATNEIEALCLANLGAGLAVAGALTAIRGALAYDLSDLPLQGRLAGGEYTVEAWSRLWNTNMRAWKIVALGVGR